ncbi:MAG: beta strand repeat-containing protein [Thermoanaerobaculia bacterium]
MATTFPSPFTPANVTLSTGSAVVYQAGTAQTIESNLAYQRLFLQKIGTSNVFRDLSTTFLQVIQELFVDAGVTVDFDNDILDVDGNINGNGTIQLSNTVVPANMTVAGNWSGPSLAAANGTTVTYDGSGPQVMKDATYQNLVVNKPSGDLTLSGTALLMNSLSLTNGNIIVSSGSFTVDVGATVSRISGHFVGPLTMGLNTTPSRRFEVGTATSYMPVDVDAGIPGTITIKAVDGPHPSATGINTLDRYWTIGAPFTVTNIDSLAFTYNQSDVTNGDETKFRLAKYDGANWSDFGDVDEINNTKAMTSALSSYTGDWVIGQKGSTGFASQLAITSVNGGVDPTVNVPFNVIVEAQYDDGSAANVSANTTANIGLAAGTGTLSGGTATIPGGSSSATVSGLTYNTIESNVQLTASASTGDVLQSGNSALFDVVAASSTLTVTTTADSGTGSLRDAISIYNAGGCPAPCTINFASTGTGNIVLASQLPPLIGGQLTIDGFTGTGAQPNTNAFSQPLNSVITVSIDGNNTVPVGLILQSANTTIKGLGFRNFNVSGTGEAIKIDGVSGCSIAGNYIGTDNSGTAATPNYAGVIVNAAGATGNIIGGNNPADRNLISGNVTNGITIVNADANEISNNFIGTQADGASGLGNGGHGVSLTGSTGSTKIGLTANRIAFNALKGVEANTTGIGNLIRENEIYSNTGIAIDLGTDGPTANIAGDADTGANNLQNYPDITTAQINGGNVDVTLSLDSSLGVSANFFVIDLYKADGSSPAQAAEYLGASGCLGGILSNQIVSVPTGSVTAGSEIVATATAYGGAACTGTSEGTSELSPGFTVSGDVHWIAGSGSWETAANWDTGSLPGPNDNAIIDAPGTYAVTLSSGQTVKSLTIGTGISGVQTLQVLTGPLTLNAASTITSTGALDLSHNLQGTGTLTNNGQLTWNTGTISNAGVINNTANMTIASVSAKALNGTTLTNSAGASILWSGGTINLLAGGAIANAGLFETNLDAFLNDAGSAGAFTNTGTFRKSGGVGSTTFANVTFNHNGGTMQVQQGVLDLAGGSASAAIDISSGKKILINSDTFTLGTGTTLPGAGKIEVSAGGTLTVNTNLDFPGLHVTGGLVNGSGNVGANTGGVIVWDSGTFGTGGGTVQITGSGLLQIATPSAKTTTRTIEIIGASASAIWSGGTINFGTGASVNNTGTFESTADTTLNNSGIGAVVFTNSGTFKKSGGVASTLFSNIDLVSSNLIRIMSGTVNLANATFSGTVDLDPGTVLLVDSDQVTLNAPSFIDSGLLQVTGGTLTMNGIFSLPNLQFDNGTLNGSGTITHNGPFVWNGGTLSGGGATVIDTGGSLTIATGSAKTLDRTLSVLLGRTATWSGGTVNMGTNATIFSSGTIDMTADNIMSKSASGTPTISNSGTLRKSAGAGSSTFSNVTVINTSTGTLQVQSGSVNLADASISGTVDVDPGMKLIVDSDVVTIAGANAFPGIGSVEVQGGTLMVSSNVALPALNFTSGVIDGNATLTLSNTATWGGGTMQGSGITEVANLATLTMNGVAKALNGRTLRPLAGSTVNWNLGTLNVSNFGNIDNSGLFDVTFDGTINNGGTAGPFHNNSTGTLRKSTTTGSLALTGIDLVNNGILDIDLGKVDVSGTYQQGATGSLDILLNGVVPGTQHGQLVTNSSPSLAGALNITFNGAYQPLVNDDFAVVSWPSDAHSGTFTYNLPTLTNGRTWSNSFNATGVHLFVNGGDADLSITKTASFANVVTNAPISYILTVSNAGPDSAANVTVTDTLPPGHTGFFANGTGWSCGSAGDTVTCTASTLPVGTAPDITINAIAPSTAQTMINTASVSATSPDPNSANNSDNATVTVDPPTADIEVTVVAPAAPVAQNTGFQLDFTIGNNGAQPATNVSFSAPIPAALTYVQATPSSGTCNFAASTITCSLGTVPVLSNVHVIVDLTTGATAGTHTVTGTGSATENDPVAGNNSVTATVQVSGGGVVVTNTSDSGPDSLRQALLDAQNAVCTSPCTISFNLPGPSFTITPITDLPPVASNVFVDGSTQPGFAWMPIVQIDASLLNTSPGTFVLSGNSATIRGLALVLANGTSPAILISGNNNTVVGNYIGADAALAAAANGIGISISGNNNQIGTTATFDGNVIAHNTNEGVIVTGTAIGNSIVNNNTHDNGLLGIDLGDDGPTPNIAGDVDTGANNLQNFPTITSAVLDGLGNLTINAGIDSSLASAGSIRFEFFEADASGEGETPITRVCTAGNAFAASTTVAAGSITAGTSIVATATAYSDAGCTTVADGTSEFSAPIVVTNCTPPPATLTTPPSICSNASAAASVNAPSAVSFNWSATNATITAGQGTSAITFTAAASGSVALSVTVADSNGCVNTVSNTFGINPPPVFNIVGPATSCAGSPVTLDAGNFASYAWSNSATTRTITVSPTSTQTYSVTVTDSNGCTASDSHTVTVSANPAATITAPPAVCANANGNASVASQAGATYAWTIANGTIVGATNGPNITFTAGATGNVALSVDVTAGTCTTSGSANVIINATPIVNIAGPTATCAGAPVTLDAGNFAFYSWSTGATTQTITVSPASTQTYSVTVTDGNGCTASDSHTVTVSTNPTATITAPAAVCANTNGNASVASQAGATYAWTVTNGTIVGAANGPNITFTAGAAGNVALSVNVTAGTCSSNGSTNVPITAPPVVTITGPTSVCASTPFTLDAGSGFTSYLWSTGATSPSITVTQTNASQTYSVTVSNGGCSATDTHTVTASGPNATITAPSSVSEHATGLSASVPAQAGAAYVWTIDNGTITAGQGTNAITFDAGDAGLGSTTLTAQVTVGGCSATGTVGINVNGPGPSQADLSISKSAPASVQAGANIVYTITVHNAGPSNASYVTVTDPLPAGTSLVSFSGGTFACALMGGSVVCSGPVASGATRNISITLSTPLLETSITNTATVDAGIIDPNPNNDAGSATTAVTLGQPNCANVPPSLLSPVSGATSDSPVTFSWTSVAGALDYELWIVTTGGTSLAGTTAATSLTVPLAPGSTTWYVVARLNGTCAALTSQQRTFTVRTSNGCNTNGAPQLTAPAANSTVTSPVTFSWTPVPQAIGYRVWIEVNGTAAQDLGTTDGAITLTADVPPGAISAFVSALFSGCPETNSPEVTFTVPRPDPCANRNAAILLAPATNSVVNTSLVAFSWTDANADGYRLWISVDGAPAEVAGTTTETSMQTPIDSGSVEWWIENLYDGCGSVDSQHAHFSIPPRQNCATTAPQRIAPPNGAIGNGNVTFQWTSVPNAVSYELWLSVANATPTLIGTTAGTSFTHVVPAGSLQWFVRAIVDRCPSTDSTQGQIVFNPPPACRDHQPPHAIAPLPNANVTSPVDFAWSPRTSATSYELFVMRGDDAPQLVATTPNPFVHGLALQSGKLRWFVRANADGCSPLQSPERSLEVVPEPQGCADLVPPRITMPGQISSNIPFDVQWDEIPGATAYQLQIASNAAFDNAQLFTTLETQQTITRSNAGTTPIGVYARVRALDTSCRPKPTVTPYGPTAAVFILPAVGVEAAGPVNGGTISHTIFLGPELAGQSFIVHVKEPWLSVQPSSGVVAAEGTTLTVLANTTDLPLGTSLGSVKIELTSSARSGGGISTNATTFKLPTMSISKVTPVTAAPKSTPPPDALIIPAVAHAGGINSLFQSDVRVTNSSAQLLQYQATFTPTGNQGLANGRQTTFSIDPGRTIALDDVLRGWFGTGGDSVMGTLEIRPMTQTETSTSNLPLSGLADLVTFAASRTFNVTSNGTFGQYIPAIPFANFIGGATDTVPASVLSLQQIAQSDRYRTNLGIVEGSGDPASLLVKVFGSDGQKLKEFPVNLAGGEHTQLNSFLSTNGVGPLSDGRVEISVVGGSGKVTAYASVLDNSTSDPLLVTPVTLTDSGNTKWVVPGVADLNNGSANWQTDMRLFNAGTADVDATLTFYSQGGGTPHTANVTIPAGQVRQFDKALASVFGMANDGGAIHVSTAAPTRLVATARTYNQTATGTYGQFISGVTPNESAGVGSRPLQILQVEESNRFRSNIGLAETTGNPVKLEIAIVPPDAKFTVVSEVQLQANEFRQIGSLLRSVGLQDTYNARVTVRAIEGTGRVTAYASVIDMLTNDPTYVPAQ